MTACQETMKDEDDPGVCIACGAETGGVKPDAEAYACNECAKHTIDGAEQVILLGLFH